MIDQTEEERRKAWRIAHEEYMAYKEARRKRTIMNRQLHKESYEKRRKMNVEQNKAYRKNYHAKMRIEALNHYGGKCACCGESHIEFLAIDHINGGGAKHRREVVSSGNFYPWLKKNHYPDGFRTLCHNCNLSLGFYGYCPHGDLIQPVIRSHGKPYPNSNPLSPPDA